MHKLKIFTKFAVRQLIKQTMKPIKDKSLYYFILQDESSSMFSMETSEKSYKLRGLKENDLEAVMDFFKPQSIHHYVGEDGLFKHRMISAMHYKAKFKVKYLEEVIDHVSYQNSVKFTIGSSVIKKENTKYLVGIDINMEELDRQFKRILEGRPWYNISFEDFQRVGTIGNVLRNISDPLYNTGFGFSQTIIESDFLGHAGNRDDVHRYSYDDNFKYYTLLCS